jgi:hypothetical protein
MELLGANAGASLPNATCAPRAMLRAIQASKETPRNTGLGCRLLQPAFASEQTRVHYLGTSGYLELDHIGVREAICLICHFICSSLGTSLNVLTIPDNNQDTWYTRHLKQRRRTNRYMAKACKRHTK